MNLRSLTDKTLLDQTAQLAKTEREVTLRVLHHLSEISRRRLFSELGHSSLFSYCVEVLKYSESAAHRRIQAMHALIELPELEGKIESGALTLSNLASAQTKFYQSKKAGKPLAAADKKEILKSLEGKSKQEADRDLEMTFPKQTTVSNKSEVPQQTLVGFQPDLDLGLDLGLAQSATVEFKSLPPAQVDKRSTTKRMVPVNEDLIIKLKGLLAHKAPGISDERLIEMALMEFVKRLDPAKREVRKKKTPGSAGQAMAVEAIAETAAKEKDESMDEADIKDDIKTNVETDVKTGFRSNTKIAPQKLSKAVPASTRRAVWRRAGSCCETCKSHYALQIDHILPRSFGGDNSAENLRLLCRNCNQRQAIVKLGSEKMDPYLGRY